MIRLCHWSESGAACCDWSRSVSPGDINAGHTRRRQERGVAKHWTWLDCSPASSSSLWLLWLGTGLVSSDSPDQHIYHEIVSDTSTLIIITRLQSVPRILNIIVCIDDVSTLVSERCDHGPTLPWSPLSDDQCQMRKLFSYSRHQPCPSLTPDTCIFSQHQMTCINHV